MERSFSESGEAAEDIYAMQAQFSFSLGEKLALTVG
ncbi:MAG: hypothetical protein ACI92G_004810, partial [Candidatus Pelagisphaera sp.]